MRDESSSHQLAHQDCEVGSNGLHPALQVVKQLTPVLRQRNDLQSHVTSMHGLKT